MGEQRKRKEHRLRNGDPYDQIIREENTSMPALEHIESVMYERENRQLTICYNRMRLFGLEVEYNCPLCGRGHIAVENKK